MTDLPMLDLPPASLVDVLGDYAHAAWSHWMEYLFSVSEENEDGSVTIPPDKVKRWRRQIATPYQQLSEKEKDSDRRQAHRIIRDLDLAGYQIRESGIAAEPPMIDPFGEGANPSED